MRNITHGVMSMLLASWALVCPMPTAKGGMAQRTRQVRVHAKLLPVILACVFFIGGPGIVLGQEMVDQQTQAAPSWTRGYTLIMLDVESLDEAYEAVDVIQAAGGRVAIIASPRVLLGWVPRALDRALIGQQGIQAIHRTPVSLSGLDDEEVDAANFFNQVASGQWEGQKRALAPGPEFPGPDELEAPAFSRADFIKNLQEAGLDPELIEALTPSDDAPSPGNSDNMIGKANFNAIFVESRGGCDANRYTWTSTDISTIKSEISASLSFWSSRSGTYGVPLTWVTSFWTPPDSRVTTCYEPILHSQAQDSLWISQIMCNFGFCTGDKFSRTTAFNASRRVTAKTNWAVTSFIGYNPSPAPTTFTDGFFAYAYINGPYSQLLFRNDGWAVSQYDLVNAHETGHLFGARDEYASSGCNNCFVAGNNGVFNGNCVNCNSASVPSIMRSNELALDGYCPGMIGWAVLVNHVRPVSSSGAAKSNWVPGQTAGYQIQFQLPGRPSSLGSNSHTVTSRWFVQFPGGVTQSHGPFTNTGITTGTTWNLTLSRAIPSVGFGEATLEVFIEVSNYGKGGRASLKNSFYIVGAGANPIPTAPPPPEEDAEPVAAEPMAALR